MWLGLFQLCLLWALPVTVGSYEPNEMECPEKVDGEIFALKYWVVPGTPSRAWKTLPCTLFTIMQSTIPKAGMGVFANTFIPKHTWLGEYDGEFLNLLQGDELDDAEYTWRVYTDDEISHYIDAMDPRLSNWLRFINCPRHIVEENVIMHTCYGRVYYRTKVDIVPGTELMVYYGDDYAENNLGINTTKFHMMDFAREIYEQQQNSSKRTWNF